MKQTAFERYWESTYSPNNMPGVFNEAMKEIAYKAWNEALDKASQIVSNEIDLNATLLIIGSLKYYLSIQKPEPTKPKWEHFPRSKWKDLLDIIAIDGLKPIEQGFGTHTTDETYQIQGVLYNISTESGFVHPIEIVFKKVL